MPATMTTRFDGASPEAVQALDGVQLPGILNYSERPGLIVSSFNDGRHIPRCYRLTFALCGDDPVDLEITFRRDGTPVGDDQPDWQPTDAATEATVELLRALARPEG